MKPGWLGVSKGADLLGYAQYHRNSATYGGSAPARDLHMEELVETIDDAVDRRYPSEYHVAEMVASTGGTAITGPDGVRRATQLYTFGRIRPVRVTFSYCVMVLAGTVALMERDDAEVAVDGVTQPRQVLLTANGEWQMANGVTSCRATGPSS